MREQGWYLDPYWLHGERWYSAGTPTTLVRDGGVESRDAPPPGELPAVPVPLNPTPSDASDMLRADDAWVNFFAEEPLGTAQKLARKPWWLATTSSPRGFVAAGCWLGLGAGELITSFFLPAGHLRIEAVIWLAGGAWFAASAIIVRRRQRES